MTGTPGDGVDHAALRVGPPQHSSAGLPGVTSAMRHVLREMGPVRGIPSLLKLNQTDGIDCMSCAWPDPEAGDRSHAEFCENGAKALASEATRKRVRPELFAERSIDELFAADDYWLNRQGRITTPMLREDGATHYRPISWDEAFRLIAQELRGLDSPDQAAFYTSGRTSNEAAFLYQLMVRGLGTNNLPDCSNMCHESSGEALGTTIGIGKGSVTLHDVETARLILIAGQNPGTNHPRMLSSLEKAKHGGATIVAINPLPEAGLMHYRNPQTVRGMVGRGTSIADHHLQVRLGGDLGVFQGLAKVLLEAEECGRHTVGMPAVLDHVFIDRHTEGLEDYLDGLRSTSWGDIEEATGLREAQIREVGELLLTSDRTVVAWAMGLTQHKHSVATIQEIVNLVLLQGNLGRPGAGLLPVRGHSNVQGDRTMGIFEKMPTPFLDRLSQEFAFTSPREHGHDTVETIRAMRDGRVRFFMSMGGNFLKAAPDSTVTEAALRSCSMTVQVSTKLNHSHFAPGRTALILPTLGRSDLDVQAGGRQRVTVEDSMSVVHASSGHLRPPSPDLLSEIAIVCRLARALFHDEQGRPLPGTPRADWAAMEADYWLIRRHIAAVVPGFADFEERIDVPGGFRLPHGPHDVRVFETTSTKAHFTRTPLWWPRVPPGRLLLQTLRSHDQYNTTVYGPDDRYRGITGGRRVVMVNQDDLTELGLADGDVVDLVSEFTDGVERRADGFRVVAYDTARGCAAAYFPETNVLVPLDSTADRSNTPTSKSVVIRLERPRAPDRGISPHR
ncbi:FdhF/YdeP family oxidoreductase [Actinotalea sp. K2]|uniref:FdhF/YdeP family oxidoreductase n=1 Tax=Actinotalea sp. K2 TaxID=2939438 RepID=UPI0020181A9C|nr:FdhF/YdeP family oxidoreductase [Actinotalea sp. K2]MCL3860409.1 FdhF/YdeP family oxidoreductase [Actinotalea sp. K2]